MANRDEPGTGNLSDGAASARPDGAASRSAAADETIDQSSDRSAGTGRDTPSSVGLRAELFPNYEIVREISRGGQAVVYQAIHRKTRRKVAIKVMHQGPFAGPRDRMRFEREVQVLAQMSHPRIVAVLDSGQAGGGDDPNSGSFFLVMDYVPGEPLDQYLERIAGAGKQADIAAVIRVISKACEAVHAAHLRGVIHRDLKPGNIRVDPDGEPHILDFGLAKTAGESDVDSPAITLTGQFMGTPAYSSPEQAAGLHAAIDVRTDVYAMGVILFQSLTGAYPYDVRGPAHDVLRNVAGQEPSRPSRIRRGIDDELDTIVLKCLQKERERRYQSAGDLSRDLQRYLAGEPIEAKRDSAMYLLRKALRRHRLSFGVASAFAVVVAGGLVVSVAQWQQAERERDVALQAKHAAEESRNAAHTARLEAAAAREEERRGRERFQNQALGLLARAEALRGDQPSARSYLLRAKPAAGDAEGWWWAAWVYLRQSHELARHDLLSRLAESERDEIASLLERKLAVRVVADQRRVFLQSPSQHWLAVDVAAARTGTGDKPPTADPSRPLGHGYSVEVQLVDVPTHTADATTIAREQYLVLTKNGKVVRRERAAPQRFGDAIRTVVAGGRVALLDVHTGAVLVKRLRADADGDARLVDELRIDPGSVAVTDFDFTADGRSLHTVADDLTYQEWAVGPVADVTVVDTPANATPARAMFDPASSRLLTAGIDGYVRGWDARDSKRSALFSFNAGSPGVLSPKPPAVAFSGDGGRLITAAADGTLRQWELARLTDAAAAMPEAEDPANQSSLRAAAKSASGAVGRVFDSVVAGVRRATDERLADFELPGTGGPQLMVDADGRFVLGIDGTTARKWTVSPGNVRKATAVAAAAGSFSLLPPGHADANQKWEITRARLLSRPGGITGKPLALLLTHRAPPGFTSRGQGKADLWDAASGRHLASLPDAYADFRDADVSPDGSLLAVATPGAPVLAWDLGVQKPLGATDIRRVRAAGTAVAVVRFHPTRAGVVATGWPDGRVVLWEARSGQQLAFLTLDDGQDRRAGGSEKLTDLAFSHDGRTLAVTTTRAVWWFDLSHHDARVKALSAERDRTEPTTNETRP